MHVLVVISKNPDVHVAEIADLVGLGERAAVRIIQDAELCKRYGNRHPLDP